MVKVDLKETRLVALGRKLQKKITISEAKF